MPKTPLPSEVVRPSVDGFLRAILKSGLLDRDSLQAGLRTMPLEGRDDPEAVAEFLIKTGKLTRFQSRKLLQGMALGLILGPFEVLAPIGRGGMGTVYLARDKRSGLLLALKVLPPRRAREEERLLARFRREMEMCQRVSHPHLAWTYEVGVCQGVYFIAMEYIPGKSLHRLVAEEGPLAVPRAARLFGEVALALEHAHTQGLVHRDLKPSNIIITPNDHAKLLDLGLALMRGERTEDGREVIGGQGYIVGTMDYISPEQTADPSKVDARCDIYSLGCTLYFAVGGRSPFAGGTSREKIKRHRTEEAVPVNQVNSSVPVGFADLIQRMMAKDPDGRPASAAGLRFELLSWADRGKGLPLDRPDDRGYQEAVALLEAKEPSAEAVAELIPASEEPAPPGPPQAAPAPNAIPVAVIPVKPASPRRRRPPRVMKNLPREPMAPRLPLWLYFLIPTVAGILVGLALLGYYLATRT